MSGSLLTSIVIVDRVRIAQRPHGPGQGTPAGSRRPPSSDWGPDKRFWIVVVGPVQDFKDSRSSVDVCGQEVVHDAFAVRGCHRAYAGQPQEQDWAH